ncbi:hypothetical protein ABZ883_09000 [Streptomyces sp. NPDC046977]|uniref:hypothetical protein n=1 Tax=Streptomyces sp. NPDC046977 TaxID=3154703 RepID=UPI0033FBDE82
MTATLGDYLSLIDELLAGLFPETEADDANGYGGPHHRVCVLWNSRDFWDDDGQAWREAEADGRARLDALIAALAPRWGAPVEIDLWPYLKAGIDGEEVPEPLFSLSQQFVSLQAAWPVRDRDRWLALAVGQADKELPFELLAAVGRGPVPA